MVNQTILNNRYQILQTIGRGGFSQTFLATDTHLPSRRKCVIKKLQPIVQKPEEHKWVQDRFQREATILEHLGQKHPQIPELFAYFSEQGNFYLVQEWIEGLTLRQQREKQGKFSELQVQKFLADLLPVLDYIHRQRMIHRDIKPDNIIIRKATGRPVLIDFGAVKEAMSTAVHNRAQASVSVAIGTPGFMPSEQLAGRPLYSSDLYSLGLTAIYLLTGKIPQSLPTDSRSGEILWRREVPEMHSGLAMVLDQAIRQQPRDRFASAAEMLAALEASTVPSTNSSTLQTQESSPLEETAATLVVARGIKKPSESEISSTVPTVAVNQPPPDSEATTKSNGCLRFCVSVLIFGGLSLGFFVLGFNLLVGRLRQQPEIQPSPSPEFEQPVEVSPTPSPTPTPVAESTPTPSPTPTPTPVAESTPTPTPQPSPTPTPTPTPPPSVVEPKQPVASNTPKPQPPSSNAEIPTFSPGTPINQVKTLLGEPTSTGSGNSGNTEALAYYQLNGEISLKYLFDPTTGQLRQTQITFKQSVSLAKIQATLDRLFGGKAPEYAQEGLRAVYQRGKDRQWIAEEKLKGLIKRNQSDRIYLEISASDFP